MALAMHKVQAAPHCVEVGLELRLHEYVPSLSATPQLTHLLGVIVTGKRGAHAGPLSGRPAPWKGVRSIRSVLYAPARDPAS